MRIAILTQALHGNYGGLLQNYALQQILQQIGHTTLTLDRHLPRRQSLIKDVAKKLIRFLKGTYDAGYLSAKERAFLTANQQEFIRQHIDSTSWLISQESFDRAASAPFDAFIVGSDQCWRPCYSANILNYFLDFTAGRNVKRISYAASFGVDRWEYTEHQTNSIIPLIGLFDAISVREESAVTLVKCHLGQNAAWVLDPTMLLGASGFQKFLEKNPGNPFITNYLLEASDDRKKIIRHAQKISGITEIRNNLSNPIFHRFESIKRHQEIPVESWLSNIANASLIITDSFHGAVFSILFNVPFLVRLNTTRGNTRIESLLKDFSLENCLIQNPTDFEIPQINWDAVNRHLASRRAESMKFLEKALS